MLPLEGIKVVDLTRILSGPYCTMTLADFGAEVIKIETTNGDDTRQWGPPFMGDESAYYLSVNRNKKSITLDLKEEAGREVLYKLVKDADVVVENFRPGTLERLGADYETLKKHNEGIILASISGFGQTGPYAGKPGYDVLAQAMGGVMSVTGEPDSSPVKAGFSIADIGTGMWGIIGILTALIEREKSGKGQWVDANLLDTMLSWQTYLASGYFATKENPKRLGGAHPSIVPYQVFEASNGHFVLAVGNDNQWRILVETLNNADLKAEHYQTNPQRVERRDVLIPLLNSIFKEKKVDDWVELFEQAKIPAGPVNELSDILEDAHILERDMVVNMEHPTAGDIKMVGIPVKLSRTPGEIKTAPPALGEHTEELLTSLGYSDEIIAKMKADGIIAK